MVSYGPGSDRAAEAIRTVEAALDERASEVLEDELRFHRQIVLVPQFVHFLALLLLATLQEVDNDA